MASKPKQLDNKFGEIQPPAERRRWVRNGELAKYLGVSKMYVWRLKHNPSFNFPPAAVINAMTDALGHEQIAMPATPLAVWRAAQQSPRLAAE